MADVQNFTYHSHNNSQGIFDGSNSAEEMIGKAEELGFEAIGVSNHLCLHPNMPLANKMFLTIRRRPWTYIRKCMPSLMKLPPVIT